MKAYFCDRCGEAYPIRNKVTLNAWKVDEKGNYGKRSLGGEKRLLDADICPKCILKLDDWLNKKD